MFDFTLHTPHPHSFFRTVMQFTPRNVKSHFHHWPHYASHVAHITSDLNIFPVEIDIAHFAFTCLFFRLPHHVPPSTGPVTHCTLHPSPRTSSSHIACFSNRAVTSHVATYLRKLLFNTSKNRTSHLEKIAHITFDISHVACHIAIARGTSHIAPFPSRSHIAQRPPVRTCLAGDELLLEEAAIPENARTRARKHWIDTLDEHPVHSLRFCDWLCSDRPSIYIRANTRVTFDIQLMVLSPTVTCVLMSRHSANWKDTIGRSWDRGEGRR